MGVVYRVKEAFSFDDSTGVPITPKVGMLLPEGHPWVSGHERFLELADEAASRSAVTATETAVAGPGQVRTLSPGTTARRGRTPA